MSAVPAAHCAARPWKPIVVSHKLSVTGGFTNKPHFVSAIELHDGGGIVNFVEVTKNSEWFLKSAGGNDTQKGHVKRVRILDMLETAVAAEATVVQGAGASRDAGDVDPMDALDVHVPADLPKPKKNKKKHEVVTVQMPLRPYDDAAPRVDVSVYFSGKNGKKLLVRSDHIPWLMAYAADEIHHQGVAPAAVAAPARPANCTAVADLNVEWNFQSTAWEAEFIGGPHRGVKRRFSPQLFSNSARWERVVQADAPVDEKKSCAKRMVIDWCKSIVTGDVANFESEWDLGPPAAAASSTSSDDGSPAAVAA